jgi:pfkB family carbohydrate kinase/Nucleoside 2-deoxyribosyltransferase
VIISGGTYVERCQETGENGTARSLIGSGCRAAAVLRQVSPESVLRSAIDDRLRKEADVLAETLGLTVEWRERSEPVTFHYWTPLSAPTISGPSAEATTVALAGEHALAFGMLESRTTADVDALVFDPQQPRDLGPVRNLAELKCGRLALVANVAETRAMSGELDLSVAAKKLLESTGAEVVITKQAARGALVTTAEHQELVGPWPTPSVWPIGSGDVFAAGFAWAWMEANAEPVEAARVGSHAASRWCTTRSLDLTKDDFQPSSGELTPGEGRVYLAAPFFSLGQRWLVELVRDSLIGLGGNVFSPLHDVGLGSDEVATLDLAGLQECTSLLALLDDADPGAMFEAGWAGRDEMPLVVFTERPESDELKMVRGTGASVCADLPTAVYRALWASMGMAL